MADNKSYKSDATATIATVGTKEVTFSGETTDVQLVELVAVTGAEGARTLNEISTADGILCNLGANNDVTVTSGTVTVTGVSTESTLSTINGKLVGGNDIGDVTINNAAGASAVNIQDGGNTITVDGTVTANLAAGTNNIGDVDVLSIAAGDNNIGNVDIVTMPNVTIGAMAALVAGTANIGDVDVLTINGVAPAFGSGVRGATVQRVTIATDDVVPVSQSGTWTVQPGNTANTTPWLIAEATRTTGGPTTFHLVSAASTNATNIKASAGQLYGWYVYNSNASARKVAFHNTAGTPTAGASVYFSLVIPGSSGANVFLPHGIPFSTGIAITTVTGLADSDATAVALNDLVINLWYA